MVRAVIFDIDGTLLDSVDQHARAWQEAFQAFGHEIPFEEVRYQIGKGGDQLLPVFLSPDEIRRFGTDLENRKSEIFRRRYLSSVHPFPGVRELFLKLHENDVRTVLASSASQNDLKDYKRILEVEDLLDADVSSDEAERSKPHPDIFAVALEKLNGIRPVVVVGDTPYDAEAARKLHLPAIGLLCGGFPEDDLWRAGCAAIYAGPADLLRSGRLEPAVISPNPDPG